MDRLGAIPAPRRDAAWTALTHAAQHRDIGAIAPLKGGISGALIYRVEVGHRQFVLRLEPERVAPMHRRRGFACMEAAAAVGVAPAVRFADPTAGIVVMDWIDARPLATKPGGRLGLAHELGTLIARIQTAPPFPALTGQDEDMIAALLRSLAASGLFAAGLLDPHRNALARIRAAMPWHEPHLVAAHNDPNPRNLLFDGTRLWLVDWELAARNDTLFDLAVATIEIADTPELEAALLAGSGHAPSPALHARLHIVRLLARLFYGCIALDAVKAGHPGQDTSLDALSPAAFRAAATAGQLPPQEIGHAFGKMSLAAFLDGCSAPDFGAVLAMAGQA